jgi:hypothetical protein
MIAFLFYIFVLWLLWRWLSRSFETTIVELSQPPPPIVIQIKIDTVHVHARIAPPK